MRDPWRQAERSWRRFLACVDLERARIQCSISNAWFRGHSNADFKLLPSLLRPDSDPNRVSADTQGKVTQLESEIAESRRLWDAKLQSLKRIKAGITAAYRSNDSPTLMRLEVQYEDARTQRDKIKADIQQRQNLIKALTAIHYGEQDAYTEFRFRSEERRESSWETLAEMQHYRVPTRLLDWTEVLALAVYFAVADFIQPLEDHWRQTVRLCRGFGWIDPEPFNQPVVWILNPYLLSRSSFRENMIVDLSIRGDLDYYERFFVQKDWPFDRPVPSYSPWRNPRLAAQQGMFTVHGLNRAPIDEQISGDAYACVPLPKDAAVYAVRHLKTFFNIDRFIMFRDEDSLGERVRRRFVVPRVHSGS